MFNSSTRNVNAGEFFTRPRKLRLAVLGLAAALFAACGGGGTQMASGPQGSSCDDCGTALLTMTDAAGDFLNYTVDVTALQLTKANGTVVQTLPATSTIDFTQLVDLSEVLNAGQIPTGEYVAATLTVNFANADIVVDDGTGTGVQVAPVDSAGHALGQVQLTVQLDNRHHLFIDHQRVSQLAFDLDLAASNTVNLGAQTVTVSPFVVASAQPVANRQVRARGALDSVNVSGSSYTIDLRPFEAVANSTAQMVINTTSTTHFEINGAVFTGAAGLTQLATLTDNPVTIAFGTIDSTDQSFTAQRVLAASSAEDLRRDYLSGTVLSRSGNTLTVGGVKLGRRGAKIGFEMGKASVTVGPNTGVTRDGQGAGTMDSGDISVGQHIEAYGDFSRDTSGHDSLDATAGRVRLNYTKLFGSVTAMGANLALAVQSIDGRDPSRFDFTGTGATSTSDADPAHYLVATGALDVSGLQVGAYTRLFGFVTPFGTAPPDFTADTFLDLTDTRAAVAITWGLSGTTAPFSASSDAGITVDLTDGLHGDISLANRLIDVPTLSAGLTLVSVTDGTATFAIAHRGSHDVDNFSTFADFVAALNTDLNGTTALLGLTGEGTFNGAGGTFTAQRLLVLLSN